MPRRPSRDELSNGPTPARVKAITDAIRAGATIGAAAEAAGVESSTLRRWRKAHPDLEAAMLSARATLQAELVSVVVNAATGRQADVRRALGKLGTRKAGANGDPDLALRLLASMWPESFGRRTVELTGAGGGPIAHEHTDHREVLRGRLDELAERRSRREASSG